jgi:hypothetical protein
MDELDVVESQLQDDLSDESELFLVAVQQPESTLRLQDGQGEPRQTGACPEIEDAVSEEKGLHGQAVEKVPGDRLPRVADGGQVIGPVPASQQIDEAKQASLGGLVRGQAELGHAPGEALGKRLGQS